MLGFRVGENAKIVVSFQAGNPPVGISAASFLTARVFLSIARKQIASYEMGQPELERVGANLVLFIRKDLGLFPGRLIGKFLITRNNPILLGGIQQDVAIVELAHVRPG